MSTAEILAVENPYEGRAFNLYVGELTIAVCQVPYRGNATELPCTIDEVRQKPISEDDAMAILDGAMFCHAELEHSNELIDPRTSQAFLGAFALQMAQIPGHVPESTDTNTDALSKTSKNNQDLRIAAIVALAVTDSDENRSKRAIEALIAA